MLKTCFNHIFILLLIFSSGCSESNSGKVNSAILLLTKELVPDNRTDVANIVATDGVNAVILKGETTVPELITSLVKTLDEKGIHYIDSTIALPDTATNKRYMGLVCMSVINLRKEPDHAAELVSQALLGTPVLILKQEGGWLLVRTPEKYISWTEKSSLRMVTVQEMNEWKRSDRVIYIESSGWITGNPSGTGITGDVVSGCILAETGRSGSLARVMLPDGREGFLPASSVTSFADFRNLPPATGTGIINRALLFTGVPYLWGGSSAKGVDCSGFVQNVYFMNGLILPRDASQQALCGDSVDITRDFSLLKSGDLLFFGSRRRITHVAIYKGETEYIHSSGRVMVNSLDSTRTNYSPYRRSTLIKAKRIVGSADPSIVSVRRHEWY